MNKLKDAIKDLEIKIVEKRKELKELSKQLRWLEIVSSTYIVMDRYGHSLSLDATTMVSKNCPTIGEHVVTIFVTQ